MGMPDPNTLGQWNSEFAEEEWKKSGENIDGYKVFKLCSDQPINGSNIYGLLWKISTTSYLKANPFYQGCETVLQIDKYTNIYRLRFMKMNGEPESCCCLLSSVSYQSKDEKEWTVLFIPVKYQESNQKNDLYNRKEPLVKFQMARVVLEDSTGQASDSVFVLRHETRFKKDDYDEKSLSAIEISQKLLFKGILKDLQTTDNRVN